MEPGDERELQILRQRKVNDRDTRLLRRRVVLRLDAEGKTTGETAEAVGISRKSVNHIVREYKDNFDNELQRDLTWGASWARKDEVLRLSGEGKSKSEIARSVGLTIRRVTQIIRESATTVPSVPALSKREST